MDTKMLFPVSAKPETNEVKSVRVHPFRRSKAAVYILTRNQLQDVLSERKQSAEKCYPHATVRVVFLKARVSKDAYELV